MDDLSWAMYRGGVRHFDKPMADGKEHRVHYKARVPAEIAGFRGAINVFPEGESGAIARSKYMAKFIADSLCKEDGSSLIAKEQAGNIPDNLKLEICLLIVNGSEEVGDAGKD